MGIDCYFWRTKYNEVKNSVDANTLNHRVVFAFDSQAELTNNNYLELISLLQGYDVYVLSSDTKLEINNSNVTVIDFYSELSTHPNYIMADRIHLTNNGNLALTVLLDETINNKQ